jgi:hypothetical protein
MKRFKKIALLLIALIVVSQIPFAYRHYKLRQLRTAIDHLNSQRVPTAPNNSYVEYKGVMHVHSFLGGHSSGTFESIIAAAQANGLNFVVMTEHPSANFDTAEMTLKGNHGGVLFVNGKEVVQSNGERVLQLPGLNNGPRRSIVAYPQEFKSWGDSSFDGVEVYNLFTNSHRINALLMFFDGLWNYRSYPDLLFANFYQRPAENLTLWDRALLQSGRRLVATAGNDAHANIGFSVEDSSGKKVLGMQLDPYERSFRLVRMHVLAPGDKELTTNSLVQALLDGHCFISFDVFGDATGFRFEAVTNGDRKIQGDELPLSANTRLLVSLPVSARILLFRNGNVVQEQTGLTDVEFKISEAGVYRLEVYPSQLPKPVSDQPWIISNPIYVR